MSAAAMKWAARQSIADGSAKAVLNALAYLHQDGKPLFPSQKRLAEATGRSLRATWEALQLLESFGLLTRSPRSAGARGRTSDSFELVLTAEVQCSKTEVRDARRNLQNLRVAKRENGVRNSPNLQLAESAGGLRRFCEGIGDEEKSPYQEGESSEGSIGDAREETALGWSPRIVQGGRS